MFARGDGAHDGLTMWSLGMLVPHPRDELFDRRQNARDNLVNTGRGGMNSIRLVEVLLRGDTLEKERIREKIVLCSQLGKDHIEFSTIFHAEVRRRPHSREQ